MPNAGKGGSLLSQVANFPNGGNPYLQAKAARGGAFGKGGLKETQGPFTPPAGPKLKKPSTIEPSVVPKPSPTPTLHEAAEFFEGKKVPVTNDTWKRTPEGRYRMAKDAGASAKRSGHGPLVPTIHARTKEGRKGFRDGYRSVARQR